MTRVHDMGGRFGDGPVDPGGPEDPVFAEDWHARALAVTLAAGALGQWNIDMSRHARECLAPRDYARFSYYEKWLAGLADLLVATGVLARADLRGEVALDAHPLAGRALRAGSVAGALARGGPADRDGVGKPRFARGQWVETVRPAANRLVDGGHTRLPAYAAGAQGRILRIHGFHVLPDSNAHGLGEAPEPLYSVAFAASALWAAPEQDGDEVVLDLWQSYLMPA
ncbi:MAG: nitrile hydratase subunit beta [Marinibacterium sp.]